MDAASQTVFRDAALLSGLLTEDQLHEALRAATTATPGPPLGLDEIGDELLAEQAVRLGYVNAWQADQLRAGRTKFNLGPYHIIDSLGQGGMGHVFKGEHSMLGRIEAIKVLPKSRTTPEAIESFQREIRAQAQLDHPNLLRVSYAGKDGATYFLVTEFVPGTDLRRLVRSRGRLSMQQAATVISQAAQGLHYAHQNGLVHRDIKPGNLLVTPDGHTKLADLGLAWCLTDADDERPKPGSGHGGKIVGTPDYLAPEVIRAGELSELSDIYAMGCTLYYAATGKVPFPGGTTADKLRWHCSEMPLNPRRFNPDLSDAFMEVLGDMMEKDPQARIASAALVVERLAPWTLDRLDLPADDQLPAERPRRPRPMEADLAPAMIKDTEPHFLDGPEVVSPERDTPSQTSQGTEPTATAAVDTIPVIETRQEPLPQTSNGLRILGLVALLAALLLAAAALLAVLTSS